MTHEAVVTLLMITDGRRECFQRTWDSANEHLKGKGIITHRIIVNDSLDPAYEEWLHYLVTRHDFTSTTGTWCVIGHAPKTKRGFGGAIQEGWAMLNKSFADTLYVFHLEDDFTFNEDIDVGHMITVLAREPKLAQLALKRQPWNDEEKQAGGIMELHPDDFVERRLRWGTRDLVWTEHQRFFTTNPCVYPRAITDIGWPQCPRSEGIFSMRLLDLGYRFAFWGGPTDPPKVEHIGINRVGEGY